MRSYCKGNLISRALLYILLSRAELEHDSFMAISMSAEAGFESQLRTSESFLFMYLMYLAMMTRICDTHVASNLFLGSWAQKIFITRAHALWQHTFFCYRLWGASWTCSSERFITYADLVGIMSLEGEIYSWHADIFQRLPFLSVHNCKSFDHWVVTIQVCREWYSGYDYFILSFPCLGHLGFVKSLYSDYWN